MLHANVAAINARDIHIQIPGTDRNFFFQDLSETESPVVREGKNICYCIPTFFASGILHAKEKTYPCSSKILCTTTHVIKTYLACKR